MKFSDLQGFQWDSGNRDKNWLKHGIRAAEAEQVFFNQPLVIGEDRTHSSKAEQRWVAFGRTTNRKLLTIIFTVRAKSIRIISARSMSKKERHTYEKNSNI